MLESLLRVKNFCWADPENTATSRGQFAFAQTSRDGTIRLLRDPLGVNKLFFAIHESGTVRAANYAIDLVERDVPFQAIFSVPSGHAVEINPRAKSLMLSRYFSLGAIPRERSGVALEDLAREIREQLEVWFALLAERFGHRKICVALSGGIDSGIIAAFARRYFTDVTAYTYAFVDRDGLVGEDVASALRLAACLSIPHRLVSASSSDVLNALENALCYGQDWRDFNVHCAIVNEIVAEAISSDFAQTGSETPLVLTGDLANEFLADYTPVWYQGREYYRLPNVTPGELRLALIRGLDVGDREIGVFNQHGLDVIQPYGLLLDQYLGVPEALLGESQCKQMLAREIARDLLPDFIFDRSKVRAQIGTANEPKGILPVLIDHGCDSEWLRKAFCRMLRVEEQTTLNKLVRAGRYRFINDYPADGRRINGYHVA